MMATNAARNVPIIQRSKENAKSYTVIRHSKEPILKRLPQSKEENKFKNFMMFEKIPETKKDYQKSYTHSKSSKPFTKATLGGVPKAHQGFHGKMQHFQYGQSPGGATDNQFVYGSHGFALDMSNIKPKQKISKYYQSPDVFRYSKQNFSSNDGSSKRMSNILTLEERTSAELCRKQQEAEETEKEYHRYIQEKENKCKQLEAEKKKEYELQKSYKAPWGRAGGGAPTKTHERTQAIYKLNKDDHHIFPFGRPGGGAPLRTNSGNLKTGLFADPEIRFKKRDRDQIYDVIAPVSKMDQNNENTVPFQTNLDLLAHETRKRRNVVKREQGMSASVCDPFARPGAGAPMRDDNETAVRYMMDTPYGPCDAPRLKKPTNNDIEGFHFGRGGGGAPITYKNVTSKKPTLMNTNDGVNGDSKATLYNRGGGGAPLRDDDGNLVTNVGGRFQADALGISNSKEEAVAKKNYLESLRHQAEEHEQFKEKEKSEFNRPSKDTLSWIQQGRVGKPPMDYAAKSIVGAPRVTSDVMKQRFEMANQDKSKLREYHEQLDEHSKLWQQNRQQQAQQQRQKSVEHAKTMETMWGRPGCGAPNGTSRRRKLDIVST